MYINLKINIMKKLFAFIAATLFVGSMLAEGLLFEQTYPGEPSEKTNSYTKSFTLTTGDYTLIYKNVSNGAESNAWDAVRSGRNGNASVATVTTADPITEKVSKVVVNFTQILADKTNSLCLEIAADTLFEEPQKIEATIALGAVEFVVAEPAENLCYRIVLDQAAGSANGFNRWDKIQFISPVTPDTISVAEAIAITMALDSSRTSDVEYVVKGFVVDARDFSWATKQQLFFMADDANNVDNQLFQAYYCTAKENGVNVPVFNGDKIYLKGKLTKYWDRFAETPAFLPEVKNGVVEFISKVEGDRSEPEAQMITVAEALAAGANLADGAMTAETYNVVGYVTAMAGGNADGGWAAYHNQLFWIADTPDTITGNANGAFEVYQGVAEQEVEVGCKVSVYTKVKNYKGLLESETKAPVTILESPKIDSIPVSEAVSRALLLADNEESSQKVVIVGYVARIKTAYDAVYRNISFYMSDSPNDTIGSLQCFRAHVSQELGASLSVGNLVCVKGKLLNNFYNNQNTAWVTDAKVSLFDGRVYTITTNTNPVQGRVLIEGFLRDTTTIFAIPNTGYHFVQWLDGNTDNPRNIVLTQDTTFTAEFAKNEYTITTASSNPEWGSTAGDTTTLYLDEVQISATPNQGYHFVYWNDYNTSNPRTITVTNDQEFQAILAKNTYTISKQCDTEQGSVSGVYWAEYLDVVTLTAVPNYGYHFTQWSDGIKDNPRAFVLTKDTTFTAEFALDRSGTCGNEYALTWAYDPEKHMLTISGEGAFNEHMECGVEAKPAMTHLVIDKGVTSIGENAFNGCSYLSHLTIGESVKTINNNAFYNCVNLETIINYRPTPTNIYSTAFDGVDKFECALYVLESSLDMYKNASVWRDFYYTYAIGANGRTIQTDEVLVEPGTNSATITWPTKENASTYTIEITKDGIVFCTLIFNANGQLTGISFTPSANRQQEQVTGFSFMITGLDSNTEYEYTIVAKNDNDELIDTKSGSFTTTGTVTGIENITINDKATIKLLRNGQVLILRGDKTYTITGQEVR